MLDCATDILGGVQQGAIEVKQVAVEGLNQAGAGRSPSDKPGIRRPPSGRITCCVLSEVSFGGRVLIGGRFPPSISVLTSAPSSTSRSSRASAMRTMALEFPSMTARAL